MQRAAVTQLGLALAVHLGPGPATTSLAEQLERAVRQNTAGLVGASYRKRARKLVFALKVDNLARAGLEREDVLYCTVQGSGEVCSQLQAGSLAPADLLSRHQVTLLHRTAAASCYPADCLCIRCKVYYVKCTAVRAGRRSAQV